MALLLSMALQTAAQDSAWRSTVLATDIHATPDATAAVLGRLAAGQRVQWLETLGDGQWLRVVTADGAVQGYVRAHTLSAPSTQAPPEVAADAVPRAGSGSLFASSLGLAPSPSAESAVPPAAEGTAQSGASLFGGSVLRGDIDAAHAQRREQEHLAALQREEEARARRQAEDLRRQQEERERLAQAEEQRRRQQQRELERAIASAEADRARQQQWADIQSSIQSIARDTQREVHKTQRLLQEHAREQQRQRRAQEEAQARARERARDQARANQHDRAQAEVRARQEAAARAQALAQEQARAQAQERDRQRARQLALAEERLRSSIASSSAAQPQGGPAMRTFGAVPAAPGGPAGIPVASARPQVPVTGSSGAGVRIESVQRTPGDVGPGSGSMTKRGLRVGACTMDTVQVEWNLGVLLGEPTVTGTYQWQGDAECTLPSSTTVLLRMQAPGHSGGWVRLSPVVPRAGQRAFDVAGSPSLDALLCAYQNIQRGDCLDADAARTVWTRGSVEDFVVAW